MQFKDIIKAELDRRAAEDPQFALKYNDTSRKKSIDECVKFIYGEILNKYVKERRNVQVAAPTRDEVFGLAVHYYDEDNIKVRPLSGVAVRAAGSARSTSESRAKKSDKETVKPTQKAAEKAPKREKKPAAEKKPKQKKTTVDDMFFGSLFDASMFE